MINKNKVKKLSIESRIQKWIRYG